MHFLFNVVNSQVLNCKLNCRKDYIDSKMKFNLVSLAFFFFVFCCVIVYYILPKATRWYWLLAASLGFFVLASGWRTLPALLFGAAVSYAGALIISKCKTAQGKKTAVIVTSVLLIAELFLLKYITAANGLFSSLFSINLGSSALSLAAPIGVSYYTLSLMSYVIDVYREVCEPQRNPLRHMLFACYFPMMTSGPVIRREQMNSLYLGAGFDFEAVVFGFERIIWGAFKKLVVADRLAILVQTVYSDFTAYNGFYSFFATICYALQLYADFSGCMDMVLGISECFGIKLPENFDAPFFSRSIAEFWRRWHITLGLWFKDYLMYPLLKSRPFAALGSRCRKAFGKIKGKKVPTYFALAILWLCIGVWHGGTPNYMLASGIIPGIYLISSELLSGVFQKLNVLLKINADSFGHRTWQRVRTVLLMCVCFLFARTQSLSEAFGMLTRIFCEPFSSPWTVVDGTLLTLGLCWRDYFLLAVSYAIILWVDYRRYRGLPVRSALRSQCLVVRWLVLLVGVFAVIIFGVYGPAYSAQSFIYGGF